MPQGHKSGGHGSAVVVVTVPVGGGGSATGEPRGSRRRRRGISSMFVNWIYGSVFVIGTNAGAGRPAHSKTCRKLYFLCGVPAVNALRPRSILNIYTAPYCIP